MPEYSGRALRSQARTFLGLGQQPDPSRGSMLNAAQRLLSNAPWLAIFPGVAIFLTVMFV